MNRVFNTASRLVLALMVACSISVSAQIPTPPNAAPKTVAPRNLTTAQYRAFLVKQEQRLEQIEKRAPRDVNPVLKSLDSKFIVKRADGTTLSSDGLYWNKTLSLPGGKNFKNLPKREVADLRRVVEAQINALDEWNTQKNGAYFLPADAKTIVSQLEQSGQIRTKPHAWQQAIANMWKWVGDQWSAFLKWLDSLGPKRTGPLPNVPDMSWLWPVFWVCVVALLGAIFYFFFRALGGMEWIALRRRPKRPVEFEGEDAQLLKLPPDELRDRAEAFARKGNFREALRHRFLAVLVNFDTRGVWRYDLRRTNWEHIAGLRRQENWRGLVAPLSDLTRRFDRVRYGGDECNQEDWLAFQIDAQKLEDTIPKAPASDSKRELTGAAR